MMEKKMENYYLGFRCGISGSGVIGSWFEAGDVHSGPRRIM